MNLRLLMPFGRQSPRSTDGGDPFVSLHREVDRLFDEAYWGVAGTPGTDEPSTVVPRLDIKESAKGLLVSVELPGVDEKDVEVSLDEDVLTIKGEKRFEKEEKEGAYHLMERSYGAFERAIELPYEADPSKVEATFSKGVLTVTLERPPQAEAKHRKIAIKTGT